MPSYLLRPAPPAGSGGLPCTMAGSRLTLTWIQPRRCRIRRTRLSCHPPLLGPPVLTWKDSISTIRQRQ
eukprot:361114-Chlamydomonas_euryale.AAC.8